MTIREIAWDANTIAHIARHGVESEEVEEVCFTGKLAIFKTKYNRYIALGQTEAGRYLTIVFQYMGQNRAKVITARAMSEAERRMYKRR